MPVQKFMASDCQCKNCPMEDDAACPRFTDEIAALHAQLAAAKERARKAEEVRLTRNGLEVDCEECQRDYGKHTLAAARADAVREFAAEYNQEVTARSADGFCRCRPLTEWADAWIAAERGGR